MSAANHITYVAPTSPPEPLRRWKLERRRIAGMGTSPAVLTETVQNKWSKVCKISRWLYE